MARRVGSSNARILAVSVLTYAVSVAIISCSEPVDPVKASPELALASLAAGPSGITTETSPITLVGVIGPGKFVACFAYPRNESRIRGHRTRELRSINRLYSR
jgi:hypothetical protein